MTETLERIAAKVEAYSLAERERELIVTYYRSVLYDDAKAPSIDDLIRTAAGARNIASMWADLDESIVRKVPRDNRTPIALAARVMYLVAELLADKELASHWAREAAIAYLQSGNVAAARIALNLARKTSNEQVPGDLLLDAILSLRSLKTLWRAGVPRGLRRPWECADSETINKTRSQLYQLASQIPTDPRFDKSVAYRLSRALPLIGSLSLTRTIASASRNFPDWYRRALIRDKRMVLLPSQRRPLRKLLRYKDSNGLLCTPTSSGKTLVAEIISVLTLDETPAGVSILVVPYQAIAYTVEAIIRQRLSGSDIEVVGAYGEDAIDMVALATQKLFLIATPEKLDSILLNDPGILSRTHLVVLDELHLVSQSGRGAFYECLIARVLQEQEVTGWPKRIIGMSAVISNTEALAQWLRVPKKCTMIGQWRPNPLIASYWRNDDTIFLIPDISDIQEKTVEQLSGFVKNLSPWPHSDWNEHHVARLLIDTLGERISWYAGRWNRRSRGPVIVFCSSRAQTRQLAFVSAQQAKVADTLHASVRSVLRLIDKHYPFLSLLRYCLERSIAYHNASLPTSVRRRLEDAFQHRAVETVYATTTLAEGSDFPFRSVIIASPSHYDADSDAQAAMSPLLMRNIAGRGGRTSGHLMGDVVQMYTPLRMLDREGEGIASHEVFLKNLLDPSESVAQSALPPAASTSERTTASAHLFNSFARVVKRWPSEDDAISQFRGNLFAPEMRDGLGSSEEEKFTSLVLSADVFGEPVAVQNSPLVLTSLGEVVTATCYDVRSVREIWRAMKSKDWFEKAPTREQIFTAAAELSGALPEVRDLRSTNTRPLKKKNFAAVLSGLAKGDDVVEAYLRAESTSSKDVKTRADRLVAGQAPNDSPSHARLEAFVEDLKQKVIHEMPALVRAMMLLRRYAAPKQTSTIFEVVLQELGEIRKRIE